jgi:hypothetical protein
MVFDNIKAIASTVKRSTRDLSIIAICDFVLSSGNDCPECVRRRKQTAERVAKHRKKSDDAGKTV